MVKSQMVNLNTFLYYREYLVHQPFLMKVFVIEVLELTYYCLKFDLSDLFIVLSI